MIYLVLEQNYENTTIIGVYDDKEKAKNLLELNKDYCVEEYELNRLTNDGENEVLYYIKQLKEKAGNASSLEEGEENE